MSEINVGIAGFGRFGRLHAGVLSGLGNARLAAVYDPDPDARSQASAFGNPLTCSSFQELLRHPVSIAFTSFRLKIRMKQWSSKR